LNLIEVILAKGSSSRSGRDSVWVTLRLLCTPIMLNTHRLFTLAAAIGLATTVSAQTTQLDAVTITSRAAPAASIGGWGDMPLSLTPLQASVFTAEQLKDRGVQRLSDLVNFDPAVSDAYNSAGYWSSLAVRGYTLDSRFNYKRDGLPINAETAVPLDNKARVEVLKGTSGMQAGTSAPGGLVNVVVKRPQDAPLRSASLEWREPGQVTGAVDVSQRFGPDQALGLRINAAAARLNSQLENSTGHRTLLALAADWRINAANLLELEAETSHQVQPSQPGFSLLGDAVPAPDAPTRNLNYQPWSLPVVFDGTTASLRFTHRLNTNWKFTAHAATQRLRTDDRVAFPYGCTAPTDFYYADRYCPSGNFDVYDFRSENERRRTDALDVNLQGALQTGPLQHALTLGALQSRVTHRLQGQAYNYVGSGNVNGEFVTVPDPRLTDENTNRDERSTELYVRDAIRITPQFTTWLGLRHNRLHRASVRTDGTRPTDYTQNFTTPWLAASYNFAPDQLLYASWGRGVESSVAPNRSRYTNAGETFSALSRQTELGLKGSTESWEWNAAWFDIQRAQTSDIGSCDTAGTCTTQLDGTAHHQGVEASAAWRSKTWTLRGGSQWLHARREGSQLDAINGKEPTNVPALTFKLNTDYRVSAVAGLTLLAQITYESSRNVLPDNSTAIPSYTKTDVALRYDMPLSGAALSWRAGVDNLFDKRAWRESPYQFGHAYLYPLAPRALRVSVQMGL
jgi:iron complex outermembrane recepter protein